MNSTKDIADPRIENVQSPEEPGYDEWFREIVEMGRKEAREHPEDMMPLAEAHRRLDL